jgi:polyhydroxybutyrate depolymerase
MRKLLIGSILMLIVLSSLAMKRHRQTTQLSGGISQTFTIAGQPREALVFGKKSANAAPLVLCFHGHGGRAQNAARRWDIHSLWPEAVVVYLQGLPGVTGITDKEGRLPGWQKNPGELADRDVQFTDAVIAQMRKDFKIDDHHIYAVGHSNGARFVNVLWKMRGEQFAAFCSAAAQGGLMIRNAVPRSLFALAGEKDPLVPYEGQVRSLEIARQILKTDESKAVTKGYLRTVPGVQGTELATYLHPGGHEFSPNAVPLVVEFFKRHKKP